MADLRDWLLEVDKAGQLRTIDGADWDQEIGCVTYLNTRRKNCPALLFDRIKGYPAAVEMCS